MTIVITAYKQSMKFSLGAIDQIRVGLKLSAIYVQSDKRLLAQALLKQLMEKWPRESAFYGVDAEVARLSPNALLPADTPVPTPSPTTEVPMELVPAGPTVP